MRDYVSKFLNIVTFHQKYHFYKKFYSKYKKDKEIPNEHNFFMLLSKINKEITKIIAEEQDGIFLKGIGYIGVMKSPIIVQKASFYERYADTYEDRYLYHPVLLMDVCNKKNFEGHIADFAFNKSLTKRISENIKSGFEYKFRPSLARELRKNL